MPPLFAYKALGGTLDGFEEGPFFLYLILFRRGFGGGLHPIMREKLREGSVTKG